MQVLGKAEMLQPGGSVKDRVAREIIRESIQEVSRRSHPEIKAFRLS